MISIQSKKLIVQDNSVCFSRCYSIQGSSSSSDNLEVNQESHLPLQKYGETSFVLVKLKESGVFEK